MDNRTTENRMLDTMSMEMGPPLRKVEAGMRILAREIQGLRDYLDRQHKIDEALGGMSDD